MSESIEHVVVRDDAGWEDDNGWFASHPARKYRLRRALPDEFAAIAEDVKSGASYLVLVARCHIWDARDRIRLPFEIPPSLRIPRDLDAATDAQLAQMFGIGDLLARVRRTAGN